MGIKFIDSSRIKGNYKYFNPPQVISKAPNNMSFSIDWSKQYFSSIMLVLNYQIIIYNEFYDSYHDMKQFCDGNSYKVFYEKKCEVKFENLP